MALVPAAQANPQTTEPVEVVSIHVTITDALVALSPSSAPRGDVARFVVRNVGARIHSFTLGRRARRAGFTLTLKPRGQRILLLYLDYRGKLPYHADLSTSGAKGIFTIS